MAQAGHGDNGIASLPGCGAAGRQTSSVCARGVPDGPLLFRTAKLW